MDDSVEDCPVCLTIFDDKLRRPRALPCAHIFCTLCINGIKEQDQVRCPTCRVRYAVPKAGQFPVCYAFEALIMKHSSTVTGSKQKGTAGLSGAVQSLLQEQEARVLAAICTCQEVQAQLDQYQATLVGWGERQQHLEDQLQALVDQSKNARKLIQQEESRVVAKREEMQQGKQQLYTQLQMLRKVTTELEADVASADVYCCTNKEKQRVEECQGMFPDVHTVTTINNVREASVTALEAATTVQADQEITGAPVGASRDTGLLASIMDRLEVLLTPALKVEDLRNLTQPARNMLRDGLVFAIHHLEGQSRHARISLEDGHLYLYSLQDNPLPPGATILQMDELVPAAPPCLVFLDLTWPNSTPHRVLINLSPDTPRGRQFLLLCTGQQGPSYANTRLWDVWNKGQQGECVCGGDYDNNNGKGGAALLPGLDEGAYRKSWQAGDVRGWWGNPARGSQFMIVTREKKGYFLSCVFGEVVDGLEGVVAAAQHSPITEVTVVDCGVVLWA